MSLQDFTLAIRYSLGETAIDILPGRLAPFHQATGGFIRRIAAVVFPEDVSSVRTCVRLARQHQVSLYPISQGRNWGLGSKLPVVEDSVVLDLSRMNRIRDVSETFGHATVEPGVTQTQLASYLYDRGIPYFLDVTGSGKNTSIVGNCVERGVAYHSPRADTVLMIEAVLGTGEVVRTGFGHCSKSRLASLYRHGAGPAIDGLFFQSNFAIVTAITLALVRRPQHQEVFVASLIDCDRIGPWIDQIRGLHQNGTVKGVVHIANRARGENSLAPLVHQEMMRLGCAGDREKTIRWTNRLVKGAWSAVGCLVGSPGMVKAARSDLRAALRPWGPVRFSSARSRSRARSILHLVGWKEALALVDSIECLAGVTQGVPTDSALHGIHWARQTDCPGFANLDAGPSGVLFSLPLIPMDGQSVEAGLGIIESAGHQHGFEIGVTLNVLHGRCLEGVISVDFLNSDAAERDRAKLCIRHLNERFTAEGFSLYRVDIDNMDLVARAADPHWRLVASLKSLLDPQGVIAPGRYALEERVSKIHERETLAETGDYAR